MIKCPKCSFEQPDDIYCAQCGVNMKTFVPEKPNFLLSLLANQPLQLAVLFIGIVLFVLYDRSKGHKPPAENVRKYAPQQTATAQQPTDIEASSMNSGSDPSPEPATEKEVSKEQISQSAIRRGSSKKLEPSEINAAAAKPNPESPAAVANPKVRNVLQISFYQASKAALAEMQRDGQTASFSGDALGGVVWKKKLQGLKTSGDLKSISSTRYKLDGHAINIFKGQRSTDGGKNIGLYFQVNTLKNDASATQLEIKSWGNLKIQDSDENLFSSDMTLNAQYAAYVAGFLPKDKAFNEEEKALLESDRALKIYTQEDFWDGTIDLIMVVELPEA